MNSSHVITRGNPQRVHVTKPEDWNRSAGTDYWAFFGPEAITAAAGSSALLTDSGWVITSIIDTAGTGADLLATGDRSNPAHALTNAAGDLIQSPSIFGDYGHAQMAASILGYQPTKLGVEFYGAMTTHAVDELTRAGWGVVEAGGTIGTAADRMAFIGTDATNFWLSRAADTDIGAADDAGILESLADGLAEVGAALTVVLQWLTGATESMAGASVEAEETEGLPSPVTVTAAALPFSTTAEADQGAFRRVGASKKDAPLSKREALLAEGWAVAEVDAHLATVKE